MRNLPWIVVVTFSLLVLSGCSTNKGGEIGSCVGSCDENGGLRAEVHWVLCDEAIHYQANSWVVDGVEFPVANIPGGLVKVGSVKVTPATLREASDAILKLDLEFRHACTMAVSRGRYAETYNNNALEAKKDLKNLLDAIKHANDEHDVIKALNENKLFYSRQRIPE